MRLSPCLEPTYEGLKPRSAIVATSSGARLEPTYEGLKLVERSIILAELAFGAYL